MTVETDGTPADTDVALPGTEQDPVLLPDGSDPDPYPLYERMRDSGEVHVVEEPTGLRRWTFVRYEQSRAALADPRLSKDPRLAWDALLAGGYVTGDPDGDRYVFHLLNTDPPDHTRLRGMIQRGFTPGRVAGLRPRIEQTAGELLDALDPTRPQDLIAAYALPLAVRTIGEMLGVPIDDMAQYHVWASAGLTLPGAAGATMSRAEAYGHMHAFFRDLLAVKLAALRADGPGQDPDMATALLAAREAGGTLSEQEIIALLIFLLNTGQEPTVSMVANGLLALFRHPDQLALLRADPGLIPGALDEFLRYDGSVALSTLRIAREELTVDGTVIPAGAVVSIIMNSADRDPRRFDDPDRLDVTRQPNPHLAFGHGIHRCLGVPLARLTGEIAFTSLLERYPDLTPAWGPAELAWRPTRVMRGLVALPVLLAPTG